MKRVLILAALGEAVTGMALLIVPSLVGRLLFGEEVAGVAIPVARVTGIALIGLGVACWPGSQRVGMLIYSAVVTLYLAYVGFAVGLAGILLWPAVVLARDPDGTIDSGIHKQRGDGRRIWATDWIELPAHRFHNFANYSSGWTLILPARAAAFSAA